MKWLDYLPPLEHVGSVIYAGTLLALAACLYVGHKRDRINIWELFTATDKAGICRTDGRKLFEAGAFIVMTVSFYFLTITGKMTEWYALIYVGSWVGARAWRDYAKIRDTVAQVEQVTK